MCINRLCADGLSHRIVPDEQGGREQEQEADWAFVSRFGRVSRMQHFCNIGIVVLKLFIVFRGVGEGM